MAGDQKKHRIGRARSLQPALIERERAAVAELLSREVSHELGNALMGVTACAKIALEKLEPHSAAHPYVLELKEAASRAAQLLHEHSAFKRSGDQVALEVDVNELIGSRQVLLKAALGSAFELELRLAEGLPATRAQRQLLDLALLGVVRAVRDVIQGGTVILETFASSDGSGTARPSLRWTLDGSRFEPGLAALSDRLTLDTGGPLPQIAAALGGQLRIERGDGGSSGVRLDLAPLDTAMSAEADGSQTGVVHMPRVLLVEDDELVRRGMRAFLEPEGITVIEAANAEEALDLARNAHPPIDMLVSDLNLPGQRGLDLFHALQVVSADLPVLFISGYTFEEALAAGTIEPGRPLISKPIHGPELARRVRALLPRP